MTEVHHHHHDDTPPPSGGDNTGIYAILIVIVILVLGAVLYFAGVFGPGGREDASDLEADVRIEQPDVPDIDVPDEVHIETPDVQVPDTVTVVD